MSWQVKRNRILFWAGMLGYAATFVLWATGVKSPDPSFMLAFGGMIGLTAALKADEDQR